MPAESDYEGYRELKRQEVRRMGEQSTQLCERAKRLIPESTERLERFTERHSGIRND